MHAPRASAVIALLLLVLLGVATPAHAADEIGVSADGITWHDHLTEPLFVDPERWVPGDVEQRSFWVRNQAGDVGDLVVTVVHDDLDGVVAAGDIVIEARIEAGDWLRAPAGIRELDLIESVLPAGDAVRVDVRVTAPWESPNRSQAAVLPLDLVIGLEQAVPAPGSGPDEPGGGPGAPRPAGGLAITGSTVAHGVLWVAAVLLGAGAALRARRSRAEEGDRGAA